MKRQNQTEPPLALAVGMVVIPGWGWGALEGGDVPGATAPLVQATCLSRASFLEFAHVSFCVLLRRGTSFKDVLLPACLWGRGASGGFWQRERRSSGWSPAPGGLGGAGEAGCLCPSSWHRFPASGVAASASSSPSARNPPPPSPLSPLLWPVVLRGLWLQPLASPGAQEQAAVFTRLLSCF